MNEGGWTEESPDCAAGTDGAAALPLRRILVHSERPVFRAGLTRLIPEWLRHADIRESGTRQELMRQLIEFQPEAAVVDASGGFDLMLLGEMQDAARHCRFLVVTGQLTPELLYHITESGCCSVARETSPLEAFSAGLEAALAGQMRIDPSVLPEGYTEERIPLSPREAELVVLLAQGMKNREIAEALNLSVGTVKVYLSHLFNKLHVKDRFELALYALRNMSTLAAGVKPGAEASAVILDWHAKDRRGARAAGGGKRSGI